ncbi:hypothetical protein D9M71_395500 [compost metagenome]
MVIQARGQEFGAVFPGLVAQLHRQRQAQLQLGAGGQVGDGTQVELGGDLGLGVLGDLEELVTQALVTQRDPGAHRLQFDAQLRLAVPADPAVQGEETVDLGNAAGLGGNEGDARRLVVQVPAGLNRQGQDAEQGNEGAYRFVHAGFLWHVADGRKTAAGLHWSHESPPGSALATPTDGGGCKATRGNESWGSARHL